ncbi:DUF58 domain-containing protein [Cellulomonas bogoriensis]|uniref:DUF58 domain-containing protein n=1 Tax=Cellulomonas bogoriensis 69B4 = DSM 16987 TaxID=1386082 RepID=A0A0A0BZD6_9CELL|nr:DUF58 domain-containing protein [Cellulomonas bogoriensis]KGM13077.1 hypothetical protein N869_16285 [Cellulomonas bogoriensis 69B4 = DSM 16987]
MTITWRAVALTALGAVPVLLLPVPLVVVGWALLVVTLCVVDVALAASPRQVQVERTVPTSVRLTESTRSTLTVTNLAARRLRALVRDAWQPSAGATGNRHPVDLPPGEARRLVTPLLPTRRGDRAADRVTLRSFGPMRLAARQVSLDVPGRLRVLPEFASRRHLPSRLARLRELDGRTAVQVRGSGTEFDSLREYVIGDDVRSIDWRATARRSEVVVRTWRPERDRRVLIVLDTARTSAARIGDLPRIDASMEAALLLSALAAKAGDRVDLIAFDRRVRAQVAGTGGGKLMPALADAMAPLEPNLVETDWPGVVAAVRERLSQRALVVLLSALEPAAVESGLLPVVGPLAHDHMVVLASVADPEVAELRARRGDVAEVFDAAAAERTELERSAVTLQLRRRGVEVVDALPHDLAPRLADTYLALKAAGRL